jgi:serine/alanine adding enzyme
MPQLNVDNPKYRLAISAWRKMPLWATRLVGPPVARLIP